MVMMLVPPMRRSLQLLRVSPAATAVNAIHTRSTAGGGWNWNWKESIGGIPSATTRTTGTSTSSSSRRHYFVTTTTSNNNINNGRLTTTTGTNTNISSRSRSFTRTSKSRYVSSSSSETETTSTTIAETETETSTETTTTTPAGGLEAYQQYQNFVAKLEQVKAEKEQVKSEKMYEAWQRANEKQAEHTNDEAAAAAAAAAEEETEKKKKKKNSKSSGVAVVRTLVKETHKEKKTAEAEETKWQEQAQGLLEKAALEFAYPLALVQLGNQELEQAQRDFGSYRTSSHTVLDATKEKLDRALDLYRRGGQGGAPEGWFNLGNLLWTGYPDQTEADYASDEILLPFDQKASVEAFRQAMDLGDADAMYFLGVNLLSPEEEDDGDGDNSSHPTTDDQIKDMRSGLAFIEKAGDAGHGGALYYLALLHLNGLAALDIPACSPPDFVKYLDAAVEAEDSDALFLRGHCLYEGDSGYTVDYGKALADFLLASDEGNADAAVSAGAILHRGHPGVPQNHSKAFELYQHAGELGNTEGWRNVVACYLTGEGVPRSKEIAKYIAETMLKET